VNPVEERLGVLHGQWTSFVQRAEARLFVWRATEEEEPMIDAFFARESEESANTPDVFVQLARPFQGAARHGETLVTELIDLYDEAGQLPEAEQSERWCCPPPSYAANDEDYLARALTSFRRHLFTAAPPSKLAVVLQPTQVASWRDYLLWLQRVVHKLPADIRLVVVDAARAPQYVPLATAEPTRVYSQACELEVLPALEELAEGARNGTPGAELRSLQMHCATRLAAGDLQGGKEAAERSSEVAKAQGWPHLAAVTSFMLAGAFLAHGRPNDALSSYGEAESLGAQRRALELKDLTEPAYGTRIRLQARLGQGAVLLSCSAYKHAAAVYGQAAELAHELGDGPSELDAHRLTSFCRSQLNDADAAWERALLGLRVGVAMDDEARRSSTLPYLADHLLRLTERHGAYASQRRPLEEKFVRLLGPSWRDGIAKGS
jgi:tetratricopeptide (TPR) repeat protein